MSQPNFKSRLVSYITAKFVSFAEERLTAAQSLLVDSPALAEPVLIDKTGKMALPANQKGEGDHGVWFHAIRSPFKNVVVFANDTDIWMYGLALCELGILKNKTVFVERKQNAEYVRIDTVREHMSNHPSLQYLRYPAACLLTVYTLSGSDYVSAVYGLSHEGAVKSFLHNVKLITAEEELVLFDEGLDNRFASLSIASCIRFLLCMYYERHKRVFGSKGAADLAHCIRACPIPEDVGLVLQWLGYPADPALSVKSIGDWVQFVRRLTFHDSSGKENHEANMCPSETALELHILRAQYAIRLVYECCSEQSSYADCSGSGWVVDSDNDISIVWDLQGPRKRNPFLATDNEYCCSCRTGCTGVHGRCKGCFQRCRPCTLRCRCRGNCQNPHNTGATCSQCSQFEVVQTNESHWSQCLFLAEMVSHSRHDHESHIAPVLVSENGQRTHSIGTVDESSEPEAGVREDLLSSHLWNRMMMMACYQNFSLHTSLMQSPVILSQMKTMLRMTTENEVCHYYQLASTGTQSSYLLLICS